MPRSGVILVQDRTYLYRKRDKRWHWLGVFAGRCAAIYPGRPCAVGKIKYTYYLGCLPFPHLKRLSLPWGRGPFETVAMALRDTRTHENAPITNDPLYRFLELGKETTWGRPAEAAGSFPLARGCLGGPGDELPQAIVLPALTATKIVSAAPSRPFALVIRGFPTMG